MIQFDSDSNCSHTTTGVERAAYPELRRRSGDRVRFALDTGLELAAYPELCRRFGDRVRGVRYIPGASEFTGQSNGLPIALPGPGELEGRGERPCTASPDPGRAPGNPIDCPVNSEAPGTQV